MKKLYGFKNSDIVNGEVQNPVEITENTFLIDGYQIADRLLEGLMFHVTFKDNKVTEVKVDGDDDKEFFSQFNEAKFIKLVKDMAEGILEEGDEVDLPSYLNEKYGVDGGYIK